VRRSGMEKKPINKEQAKRFAETHAQGIKQYLKANRPGVPKKKVRFFLEVYFEEITRIIAEMWELYK
jgi:hypothetical protein